MPRRKPATTCDKVCWRKIIRLLPSKPAKSSTRHTHHTGLNMNILAKPSKAPATPPMVAVWVLIFQKWFMMAQTTCMNSAASSMLLMK